MYNQGPNYDMMNRSAKGGNITQQRNDQANMLQTLKNLQVSALRTDFPQLVILKQTEQATEYRVPLTLSVSPQPLYIKVTLSQTFPATRPIIAVMSRVTHQNIEPSTYAYNGPCLMQWNPQQSTLTKVVQQIHAEFNQSPPMPERKAQPQGGQPQQQQAAVQFEEKKRYQGEVVTIAKPQLTELKQKINSMSPDELAKYLSSPQELSDMFMEQDEVKAIRGQILRLTESLKNQTDENVEEKSQLQNMFEQYEAKYQEYQSLKSLNDDLRSAVNAAQSKCSKEVVIGLINQKIQQIDGEARAQEKDLLKENIDIKTFMKTYIEQRTQYHKYQLMKVKVSQS